MNEFDIFNGYVIEKGEKLFNSGNRSFKYGDGVFETMKVVDGEVLYWEEHFKRLEFGIKTLKLENTIYTKEYWEKEIEKIIQKNYYKFAKIRLTVYRDSPGLYTPLTNRIGFIMEGLRFDKADFSYEAQGISLGVYTDNFKPIGMLSNCKTTSTILYVMSSIYKKEIGLDDVVVLNNLGNVCETSNSNLFIVKDGEIYTPPITEGCIAGVMRNQVIVISKELNKLVIEKPLIIKDLEEADEIFLTNVIMGVQNVKIFKDKVKKNTYSLALQNFLK